MTDLAHDQLADLRIGDVNNDGRDDVVSFYNTNLVVDPGLDGEPDTTDDQVLVSPGGQDNIAVYLSKGDGAFKVANLNVTAGLPHGNPAVGRPFSQLGDFNGDGRLDIVKNDGQLRVMTQNDAQPERITGVKDEGAGWQRSVVVYSNAWTEHPELIGTEQPCAAPLMCLHTGMTVVRQLTSYGNVFASLEDELPVTTYYSYFDPVVHLRRGFLGFGTVHTWSPDRPAETTTVYDRRTAAGDGDRYYPYGAAPAEVITVVPILTASQLSTHPATAQAKATRVRNTPEFRQLNGGATYAVFPDDTVTDTWEQPVSISWDTHAAVHVGGVSTATPPARRVEQFFDYDDFGNLTWHKTQTAGGVTEESRFGYDLEPQRRLDWLISLQTTTGTTRSEAGGSPAPVTRSSENHYDDLGRLDTVWLEKGNPDAGVRQTTTYEVDPAGVVRTLTISAPNRPSRVDHVDYAPVFAGQPDEEVYPSQLWSEHGVAAYRPSTWQAVHPAFGLTVATEDINGVNTATYHDDLGRPVLHTADQEPSMATGYQRHINSQGDVSGLDVRTVTYLGPPGTPNATVHLAQSTTDQLGRTRISTAGGFDGSVITTTSGYDTLGRQVSASRPYLYGAVPAGYTTSAFDSLDRPIEATLPNGAKRTWTYTGLFTTDAFDADEGQTRTVTDADGRASSVIRYHKDTSVTPPVVVPIATTYQYAPFDLTATTTDDRGNVTGYGHDVRGRVTSVSDPDRGPSTTSYFGTGEVKTVTHPSTGNTSNYDYDDLGRGTSRVDHDGATGQDRTTTFVYDSASNGIGQLDHADSPDGIRTGYRYDAYGRRLGTDYTDLTAGGPAYSTDTHYDWLGRVDTVTYPSVPGHTGTNRITIRTGYNGGGFPDTVTDITAGQPVRTLWRALSRNADLALTGAFLSQSGTASLPAIGLSREYDGKTGLPTGVTATRTDGTTLHHLTYGYYDNGQLHTRTQADTSANRAETFGYDDLHRLQTWSLTNGGGPTLTSTYTYDTLNNLTGILGHHAETRGLGRPDLTLPHALTTQDGDSYSYDGQGRLVTATSSDSGNSTVFEQIAYTAFDLPRTQTILGSGPGTGTWTFRYDAFGTRVAKNGPDGGTFYLPGMFEDRTGPGGGHSSVFHLHGPDGAIGQLTIDGAGAPTLSLTLADALGSTAVTTNAAGDATGSFFYDPFGGRMQADGSYLFGYTGAVHNGFTGQEHDDDLGQVNMRGRIYNMALKTFFTPDPVTGNHPYAYVNNNPTNFTDPTGYDGCPVGVPCADGIGQDSASNYVPIMSIDPAPAAPATYNEADFAVCAPIPNSPCAGTTAEAASDAGGYQQPCSRCAVDQLADAVVNWWDSPMIPPPTQEQWNNSWGEGGAAPTAAGRQTHGEHIFMVGAMIGIGATGLIGAAAPVAGGTEILAGDALAAEEVLASGAVSGVSRTVIVGDGLTMERSMVEFTVPRGASVTTLRQDVLLPQDLAGLMQTTPATFEKNWTQIGELFDEGTYAAGRLGYTASGVPYDTSVRGVFEGVATHLEGAKIPYGIMYPIEEAPLELEILQSSMTVSQPTGMYSAVTEGSSNTVWVSCTWMYCE
jgi:RHS repeat-associated protein